MISFLKKNRGKNKFKQLRNSAYKTLPSMASAQRRGTFDTRNHASNTNAKCKLSGVGFAFSGRVFGGKKAASFKLLVGSVPFNTLDANIHYSNIMQKTRNGTRGFRT